jgi:hypothetical protein
MNPETAGQVAATKSELLALLYAFINQRPRLEFANYGDASSYRSEVRKITRQRSDAVTLLRQIELRDSITSAEIVAAFRDRLTLGRTKKGALCLDYCVGQYWPTEYRAAVARVAASLLWSYFASNMPMGVLMHNSETGETCERYNGLRAGDFIRRKVNREFGRGIASRWFN